MISPCGMHCTTCKRFLAQDDMDMQIEISVSRNIPVEDVPCEGCIVMNTCNDTDESETKYCRIFQCSQEREVQFCHECERFPCSLLNSEHGFFPEEISYFRIINLCILKEIGPERWENAIMKHSNYNKIVPKCFM